jgi:hypothetical protein
MSARLTKRMVDLGAQACFMKDKHGYLPAHIACRRHTSPDKLRMLLAVNPAALYDHNNDGRDLLALAEYHATKSHPNHALIEELKLQMKKNLPNQSSGVANAVPAVSSCQTLHETHGPPDHRPYAHAPPRQQTFQYDQRDLAPIPYSPSGASAMVSESHGPYEPAQYHQHETASPAHRGNGAERFYFNDHGGRPFSRHVETHTFPRLADFSPHSTDLDFVQHHPPKPTLAPSNARKRKDNLFRNDDDDCNEPQIDTAVHEEEAGASLLLHFFRQSGHDIVEV